MQIREIYSGIENSPDQYAHDLERADQIYTGRRKPKIVGMWASNDVTRYFNVIFYISGKKYKFEISRRDRLPMNYFSLQTYVNKLVDAKEYQKLLDYLCSHNLEYSTYTI